MKTLISLRINSTLLDLFDQVLNEQGLKNRTQVIESLVKEYIEDMGSKQLNQRLNEGIQSDIKRENIKKRIKKVLGDLRKYNSPRKVQRIINTEDYLVAKAVYDEYSPMYEAAHGLKLNPPVDIKSL